MTAENPSPPQDSTPKPPPVAVPEQPVRKETLKLPLTRWTMALCIMTMGGFVFNEVTANWFSSYVKFVAGSLYVGWGLIVAIGSVVGTCFYLIWGAMSDNLRTKHGRRIPFILVGSLASAGLTVLFALSTNFIWLFIDGGILLAITRNMLGPSRSLTPDLIPQERRGHVNTLLIIMSNLGSVIVWVPALILLPGGEASYTAETHVIFIIAGAIIIAVTGTITALLIREPPVLEPPRPWVHDLGTFLDRKEMAKHPDFVRIFPATLFLAASDAAYFNYLLPFIESVDFDLSQVVIAGPIVGVMLGITIYALSKFTDKSGRKKVTVIAFLVAPIGSWMIALSGGNIWILMLGFGIFFGFYLGGNISVETWLQDILPKESRGKFFGIINIGAAVGTALGALLAGFLADTFNILWIFVATGIILWASVLFYRRVPETLKRKNPEVPKEEIPLPS